MVANRLDLTKNDSADPTPPPAAANLAEAPAEARAPRRGALGPWLPLGAAVVLMPALAYTMTTFVLLPRLQKGLEQIQPAAPSAKEGAPGERKGAAGDGAERTGRESVTLNKLLVNVAGTMGSRYLLVSLTLVGKSSELKARLDRCEPQLRDAAGGILSTKTIADLEKSGARNLLRSELFASFNNILGDSLIQEIYFTEFAIQ